MKLGLIYNHHTPGCESRVSTFVWWTITNTDSQFTWRTIIQIKPFKDFIFQLATERNKKMDLAPHDPLPWHLSSPSTTTLCFIHEAQKGRGQKPGLIVYLRLLLLHTFLRSFRTVSILSIYSQSCTALFMYVVMYRSLSLSLSGRIPPHQSLQFYLCRGRCGSYSMTPYMFPPSGILFKPTNQSAEHD